MSRRPRNPTPPSPFSLPQPRSRLHRRGAVQYTSLPTASTSVLNVPTITITPPNINIAVYGKTSEIRGDFLKHMGLQEREGPRINRTQVFRHTFCPPYDSSLRKFFSITTFKSNQFLSADDFNAIVLLHDDTFSSLNFIKERTIHTEDARSTDALCLPLVLVNVHHALSPDSIDSTLYHEASKLATTINAEYFALRYDDPYPACDNGLAKILEKIIDRIRIQAEMEAEEQRFLQALEVETALRQSVATTPTSDNSSDDVALLEPDLATNVDNLASSSDAEADVQLRQNLFGNHQWSDEETSNDYESEPRENTPSPAFLRQ